MHGRPADVQAMLELAGESHNARGVGQRFFEDPRLVRVNRRDWALLEWGLEEYTSLADEIKQRIEANGGQVPLAPLVKELSQQFDVSPTSVRVFATAPMFVLERGNVRLREAHETYPVSDDLSSVTSARRTDNDRIEYTIEVNSETLRGSGRIMPTALAGALGVVPGQPRAFAYRATDGRPHKLNVTWVMTSATGPTIGSTRELAAVAGAVIGDQLRLEFDLKQGSVRPERLTVETDRDSPESVRAESEAIPKRPQPRGRARPQRRRVDRGA